LCQLSLRNLTINAPQTRFLPELVELRRKLGILSVQIGLGFTINQSLNEVRQNIASP
jgi:hypothetical protein